MTTPLVLLPSPLRLEQHDGRATLPPHGRLCLPEQLLRSPRLVFWARQLLADLAAGGLGGWTILEDPEPSGPSAQEPDGRPDILLRLDPGLPPHASTCEIRPTAPFCVLAAHEEEGLRDALQTLRQLVRAQGTTLPCLTIHDRPAMTVRALTLDVSRGRIPTLATLERQIELLELCKFTQLQLYVEASVAFPATIEAWRSSSPLTFDDIRALDDFCWLRGIELVPALASFGHMYDILRTRRWRHLGELPGQADRPFSFVERMLHHTLNPVNEGSYRFITERMDEYAPLFRSHQFNIEGDEAFDLGKGEDREAAERIGVPRLYADFVCRLCEHLRGKGLSPLMYADIALKFPELLPQLPADVTMANWDYRARPSRQNVEKVAASGHPQLVCPGVQTWNRLVPDVDAAWSNISLMCRYGQEFGAVGMLVTDWGDYGHINDPVTSLPGLAYAAECAWCAHPADRSQVDAAASVLLLGDPTGTLTGLLRQASRAQTFGWADAVQWQELADTDGGANPDVLFLLGQPAGQRTDLPAARRTFLNDRMDTISKAGQADGLLDQADAEISALLPRLGGSKAATLPDGQTNAAAIRVMLRGQRLLNHLGLALTGQAGAADRRLLAERIDEWSLDYSRRWDSVSRPSRLDDIRTVLWRYSDLLRAGAGPAQDKAASPSRPGDNASGKDEQQHVEQKEAGR